MTKTNALEALVIAGFVRGLSTRDIEATLAEALGEQVTVSRSTVSRVCEQIKAGFENPYSKRRELWRDYRGPMLALFQVKRLTRAGLARVVPMEHWPARLRRALLGGG